MTAMRYRVLIVYLAAAAALTGHADRYVAPNAPYMGDPFKGWLSAATSIQQVLSFSYSNNVALTNGETIWVSNGTYVLSASVMPTNTVTLRICGFRTNTAAVVIDGGRGAFSNRCFVLTNANITIEGLTISNGWGDGAGVYMDGGLVTNCVIVNGQGQTAGGVHANGGTVANCVVRNNAGTNAGGVYLGGPSARLLNSTVTGNLAVAGAGGVRMVDGLVSNCTLAYNTTAGEPADLPAGGARLEGGALRQSTLASNAAPAGGAGGAVLLGGGALMRACTLRGNDAAGWGGVLVSNALAEDCVVAANTGGAAGGAELLGGGILRSALLTHNVNTNGHGGGVVLRGTGARAELLNCTLAGNSAVAAGARGGGLYDGNGTNLTVVNTLLYMNSAETNADVHLTLGSNTNRFLACGYEFSSHALSAARGNRTDNPLFVNPFADDWRLPTNSVYVDRGTNQDWMTNAVSLGGLPRIMGPGPDAGAYEYPSPAILCDPAAAAFTLVRDATTGMTLRVSQSPMASDYPSQIPVVFGTDVPWLILSNSAGTIPVAGVFTNAVGIDAAGLDAGTYTGHVQVASVAGGYGASNQVAVVLTVSGAITISPPGATNAIMAGRALPSQIFFMSHSGNGLLSYAIQTNASWLTVSPVAGVLTNTATQLLTFSYRTTNLAAAAYTARATVVFSGAGAYSQRVDIALNVLDMSVAPGGLTNASIEGSTASSRVIQVANAGGGVFAYSATVIEGAPWLTVSPAAATAGNTVVTALFNTVSLPAGDYTGRVRVATSDGGGATSDVAVALRMYARPVIELLPAALTQTVARGANPTNQAFTLRNASGAPAVPMRYTLSVSNQGGVALIGGLSSGGGINTGQADQISVLYADIATVAAGMYTAAVVVAGVDEGTGYWPLGQTAVSAALTARVAVVGLPPPTLISASRGTVPNYVAVTWGAVPQASRYTVYRALTFDRQQALPAGEVSTNRFEDVGAPAGTLCYYWVSSVNQFGGEGVLSTAWAQGFRKLEAPGGVFATDGQYRGKVRVTWSLVDGAIGYRVWRGPAGGSLSAVYFTPGALFEDTAVGDGVHYDYRVQATNGLMGSALSLKDTGFAIGLPAAIAASQGGYVDKIRVTWSPVESATAYEVWRGVRPIEPPGGGAVFVGTALLPLLDDTGVPPGVMGYYWVRAKNASVTGGWSAWARGYRASRGVNLAVRQFVLLPGNLQAGTAADTVSFQLVNQAGADLAGADGTLAIDFLASTSMVFGAGGERLLASQTTNIALPVGATTVVHLPRRSLRMPAAPGAYYLFARAMPCFPSLLAETQPADNIARRQGVVRIGAGPGQNYQVFNDFDGDGVSDLAVFRNGEWSVRTLDGRILADHARVFPIAVGVPVLGDLDADRRADAILYHAPAALWQALYSGSGYAWVSGLFGGPPYRAQVADYARAGRAQPCVYDTLRGLWYILNANGAMMQSSWGGAGFEPVLGDFDGDGGWDLAVYQPASGQWYMQTLDGRLLVAGDKLGGPEFTAVPGDFDGDGCWDAAVYHASGTWYIVSLDGRVLEWNLLWGGPGRVPVFGDYDGDGAADLAWYEEATGRWSIRTLDGRELARAAFWGGPGFRPITP